MTFFSAAFLPFLGAALALYYLVPGRFQWVVLLCASVVFYAWGGVFVLLLPAFTALLSYAAGRILEALASSGAKRYARRAVLAAALVLMFGLLFLLKYRPAAAQGLLPRDLALPMGISFYMFQSAGYVIDCYRGKYPAERNVLRLALFVSFFPQMVQGPISRYDVLSRELFRAHPFRADDLKYGIQRMMWGYLKKLLIADRAAVLVNAVFSDPSPYGGAVYAVAVLFYCIQLYCDFSGGIDITLGAAQMFGVPLPENFRRPIFAVSMADYWRRWHITLGAWMRDYLFYPLALSAPVGALARFVRRRVGARAGKLVSTALATFAVYLVIGVWHGSGLRYFVYGLYNGGVITLSVLLSGVYARARERLGIRDGGWFRAFRTLRTMALVFLGRYVTRAPDLAQGLRMLGDTFARPQFGQLGDGVLTRLGLGAADYLVIAVGMAALLWVEWRQERGAHIRQALEKRSVLIQWLCVALPLAAILFLGIYSGETVAVQFIYQQF